MYRFFVVVRAIATLCFIVLALVVFLTWLFKIGQ